MIMKRPVSIKIFILLLGIFMIGMASAPQKAQACCSCAQTVTTAETTAWNMQTIPFVTAFITSEFTGHEIWYISTFWEDNILPAMMLMADQLTAVAMQQTQIFGSFMDAKHQLETQRIFEEIRARSHKDYHPSAHYGLCEFGTTAKSLAASERRSEFNTLAMSQRAQDRHMGQANTAAAAGDSSDKESRLEQFRDTFCDPRDNNNGLRLMCDHDQDGNPGTGGTGAQDPERMNKDIDFARTIDYPWTLSVDFTDDELTNDEEEVLALASNLYGHDVFSRQSDLDYRVGPGVTTPGVTTDAQHNYLDMRAVLAKRSVAENSFNAITGLKSEGAPGSREYLIAILEELGVPDTPPPGTSGPSEAELLLGSFTDPDTQREIEPSYYAQMEILTKKLYQHPDFYTHLYDKPANVARKEVAMQAIGLMQKFDMFKSYLRSEASLSILLELAVNKIQEDIEDQISAQRPAE